jgi:hypothetical protein
MLSTESAASQVVAMHCCREHRAVEEEEEHTTTMRLGRLATPRSQSLRRQVVVIVCSQGRPTHHQSMPGALPNDNLKCECEVAQKFNS